VRYWKKVELPEIKSTSKPTNLEMANQMFKDAFLVKKTRFSKLYPTLSDDELHKITAEYFRNLPDDEGKRGCL
jgi:hypothetical protein